MNTFFKYPLSLVVILFFLWGCKEEKQTGINLNAEKIKLMETDRAFSKLSVENGMKAAFIEYIDSNGVLLKPGHSPIVGANAIDYLIQQNDTSYTLRWQPHNGFVSSSADFGYTYGIYALESKVADTVLYGTYVSI